MFSLEDVVSTTGRPRLATTNAIVSYIEIPILFMTQILQFHKLNNEIDNLLHNIDLSTHCVILQVSRRS